MDRQTIAALERAFALQQQGELSQAEPIYRQILKLDNRNIHALNLLGLLCLKDERSEEAVTHIRRALSIDARDAEAQSNYGLALKNIGELDAAAAAFRTAISLAPNSPTPSNNLGNILLELDDPEGAIDAYRQAIRNAPDYAEAHTNIARAYLKLNALDLAEKAINHALKLHPQLAAAHGIKGDVLTRRCEYQAARDAYRTATNLDPASDDHRIGFALALKDSGDIIAAIKAVEALGDQHVAGQFTLGQIKEQAGDLMGAELAYTKAISNNPKYGPAYYQLTQIKGRRINESETRAMEVLLADDQTPNTQKRHFAFGLAAEREQAGAYEAALDLLEIGHKLILENRVYDDGEAQSYYHRIVEAERTLGSSKHTANAPHPVFIIGMPRSGTTLTEQILTSHPQIKGAGESSFLEDAVSHARQLTGYAYPECQSSLSSEQLEAIGEAYRKRLSKDQEGAQWIVDKTPLNFQYIGFAARILPEARFIHCMRNPVDTCLSIFRLPFDAHQTYAHGLESLAAFYHQYHALMRAWHTIFPDRLLSLQYENVVADLETEARRALEHVGAPFDPAVLNFHETQGIVKTPSASQVRQPIYQDAVERWRRYGDRMKSLEPLLELDQL